MHDPDLSPEQDAQVRRLLAEARHDAPLPDDVAQRLDRVLDQLREDGDSAPVVDLAGHRRRRTNAGRLLLAAAAVVAAGFGVAHLAPGSSGDSGQDTASTGQVARSGAGGGSAGSTEAAPRASEDASGDTSGATQPGPASTFQGLEGGLPVRLSSRHLAAQVGALAADAVAAATEDDLNQDLTDGKAMGAVPTFSCAGGDYGRGTLLPAVYDGTPAVLALRPVHAGVRTAEVLQCGTAAVLDRVVVPAS